MRRSLKATDKSMHKDAIVAILMEHIRTHYLGDIENDDLFTLHSDLFEEGFISSIQFERFISFIEERFKVRFDEKYFFDERFSSVSGISDIILEIR